MRFPTSIITKSKYPQASISLNHNQMSSHCQCNNRHRANVKWKKEKKTMADSTQMRRSIPTCHGMCACVLRRITTKTCTTVSCLVVSHTRRSNVKYKKKERRNLYIVILFLCRLFIKEKVKKLLG